MVAAGPRPGVPSKSVTSTPSRVIVTTWSWPSSSASRVCSMNAATSEPRKFSPSPSPTTSGELRRAATTRDGSCGVDRDQRERALEPAADRAASPSVRSAPRGQLALEQVGGDLGVGLGDAARRPSASSSARSSAKFSMIPLCTSATRPRRPEVRVGVDVVGRAVGGPAGVPDAGRRRRQRVLGERLLEVGELAGPLVATAMRAVVRRGRCRRSRSRGTPAGAGPRSRRPAACCAPTYPTIPHMGRESIGGAAAGPRRRTPASNAAHAATAGARAATASRRRTSSSTGPPGPRSAAAHRAAADRRGDRPGPRASATSSTSTRCSRSTCRSRGC